MARVGEMLGWAGNPLYQGLTGNRNAITNFGVGLASGSDFGSGLANGAAGIAQGAQMDDAAAVLAEEKAQQQQALNQTTEWLKNNGKDALYQAVSSGAMTPGDAWKVALSEQQAQSQGIKPIEINGQLVDPTTGAIIGDYRNPRDVSGAGTTEYGLTPIYGRFPDGSFGLGVTGKDGTFKPVDTGGFVPNDPRTTNIERAIGTEVGKGIGGAQTNLGSARLVADTTKQAIDNLRNNTAGQDEQFGKVLGVIPQQMLPTIPGTNRGNFQVDLSQASGQAFLQAREFLKGQGQITDFESGKAESAFSRLEKAAAMGDRASFNSALNDFEAAVDAGLRKVEAQAGQGGAGNVIAAPTGRTSSGLSWSVTP